MRLAMIILIAMTTAVVAQSEPLSEATKTLALKRAYELNGNSMVGLNTIDLSADPVVHPELGLVDPQNKNEIDELGDHVQLPVKLAHRGNDTKKKSDGICARHHMHKVYYGNKWRCRKGGGS